MRHRIVAGVSFLSLLVAGTSMLAGGFAVRLGGPEGNAQLQAMNAIATVRAFGCHDVAKAEVTAVAVGLVRGEQRSIPLTLVPLTEPGAYAIKRQWPAEGQWVIRVAAKVDGLATGAIAMVTGDGVDTQSARYVAREPTTGDVDSMLRVQATRFAARR